MQHTQSAALRMAARVADVLVVVAAYIAAILLRQAFYDWWPLELFEGPGRTLHKLPELAHLQMAPMIVLGWIAGLQIAGTYRDLRRTRADVLLIRILRGTVVGATLALLGLFLTQQVGTLSRTLFVGFSLMSAPAIFAARMAARALLRRGQTHNVLVVGAPEEGEPFMGAVSRHADWGLRVLGVVLPDGDPRPADPRVLGRIEELGAILERTPVDQVYVTGRSWDVDTLRRVADLCEEQGVQFSMDANFLGLRVARAELMDFDGNSVLAFSSTPQDAEALVIKRAMDLLLGGLGLLVSAPLLGAIALAIKLEDPRSPVFFGQVRSGLHGRPFTMWKLRSMVPGAEALKPGLEAHNEMDGPVFKMAEDPRVTRVGRWIRRASLDELPQFWNVVVGEMSLVGPRPPIPAEVARYERWQMRRLSMKPGLTCIWQVSGRNRVDFATWMKLDLQYIDNWSLFLDLSLLMRTPLAMIAGR